MRARDPFLHFAPLFFADVACALFRPEFPRIRAAAEDFSVPVSAEHRSAWNEDERQGRRESAHNQCRRCFVACAKQHRAVDGMTAEHLLGLHRQKIAIEHRCRFHVALAQREDWNFERKAASLQHPALHVFRENPEM